MSCVAPADSATEIQFVILHTETWPQTSQLGIFKTARILDFCQLSPQNSCDVL